MTASCSERGDARQAEESHPLVSVPFLRMSIEAKASTTLTYSVVILGTFILRVMAPYAEL